MAKLNRFDDERTWAFGKLLGNQNLTELLERIESLPIDQVTHDKREESVRLPYGVAPKKSLRTWKK